MNKRSYLDEWYIKYLETHNLFGVDLKNKQDIDKQETQLLLSMILPSTTVIYLFNLKFIFYSNELA